MFVSKESGEITQFGTGFSLGKMIELYELQFNVWSLHLSEMDWKSVVKMMALKRILNWSQMELTNFRANPIGAIGNGTNAEMSELRLQLEDFGIVTVLVDDLEAGKEGLT